jgi:two-component system nitrogen regulation response regulator NtrX
MSHILVVDDEVGIRELLSEILSDEGHTVLVASSATEAREARARARPDLVLLDIWMPDADGLTLLKEWASGGLLTMPVVMMSGHATIDTAVEATRIGAMDFLEKPIALQKLLGTVKRALGQLSQGEPRDARPGRALNLAALAPGKSAALVGFRKRLAQAAATSVASVLLRGERGAVPEFYARAFQQPGAPWVNATTALGEGSQDVLPQAAGGVLFIDDLAALSPNQRKHLAFLASRAARAKVRLMSFSSHSPQQLVESGFEPALVATLSELTLAIPPLREQSEDIPEMARATLKQLVDSDFCPPRQFSAAALSALQAASWPGQLQEFFNVIRSLAVTAQGDEIDADEVGGVLGRGAIAPGPAAALFLDLPLREARDAFERAYFEHHLEREGGSIARVAEKCGLERTHLYRKLKALGVTSGKKDVES